MLMKTVTLIEPRECTCMIAVLLESNRVCFSLFSFSSVFVIPTGQVSIVLSQFRDHS